MSKFSKSLTALALGTALMITGCDETVDENGDPVTPTPDVNTTKLFEVSVINLTAGQPFSPVTVLAHDSEYKMFAMGAAASSALENLAEGGDNSALLTTVSNSVAGAGVLTPGSTETLRIALDDADKLTLTGMLVNTNDTFLAYQGIDISSLEVDGVWKSEVKAYDAGTEKNTETAATVPAQGGEGYNATRDDFANFVSISSGVVTQDDGLSTSALTEVNRFDNGVAFVKVTRIQ